MLTFCWFATRTAFGQASEAAAAVPEANAFLPTLSQEERDFLRAHPVVRVAHDPAWPPIEFTDEHGELSGMSADYLKLVEARLGIRFERIRGLTWQEAYARMKRWEIDMAPCVALTPERTEFWAFTDPFMTIPIVIATQLDVTYIAEMRELNGKKVVVVEGYAIDAWLTQGYPDILLVRVQSPDIGIRMLQRGEAFAYVDNLLIVGSYQARANLSNIKIAGQTPFVNAQRMAVRKDWAPLAQILDKALKSIPDKDRKEIYRKWLPLRYERDFNYVLFWQVLGVGIAVLLGLLWWNRKLVLEISSRKKAEAELRQAESVVAAQKERLTVTLRSIGDGVITTDLRGRVLFLNRAAEELCGSTQEQTEGKHISSVLRIVRGASRTPDVNWFERVIRSTEEESPLEERWLIAADGTERLITESGATIKDRSGRAIGVVLVFRDITERQKLLESAERAERLEALGLLAGGIAHDFNNLLAALFGCVELAKAKVETESDAAMYLESALSTLTRATGLTQQLLTFSRGGAPVRKTGQLGELLKKTAQFALSGSPVSCTFEVSEALWLCDYDEGQFARIVDNIVLNAVQAMPLGGSLRVIAENAELEEGEVPSLRQGKYVHIAFQDTGAGIPSNIKSRIFDPFFTTKEKGTGLGLSAVYSIVKKHDGEITVNSEPGAGTTFHIYLPVSRQTPGLESGKESAPHQGTGRVLIMDDDASVRGAMGDMIALMGYEVSFAENGQQAIQAVREASDAQRPFRIVIMDLTIPGGLGGKDAVAQLRNIQPELLVFAASGYSEDAVMASPARFGFNDCICKPFTRAQLRAVFARHVAPLAPVRG